MSLDTLLEAAKFLDQYENGDNPIVNTIKCDIASEDGSLDGNETDSATYHLREDPNTHISFQFHTYSSTGGHFGNQLSRSQVTNSSTKRNAHQHGQISRGSPGLNRSDHSAYTASAAASAIASRHREMHKTLEKNRRAHLRECFEQLKTELPLNEYQDKKTSHINIIRCAIRYISHLKRMEVDNNNEIERLKRTYNRLQNHLAQVTQDLMVQY